MNIKKFILPILSFSLLVSSNVKIVNAGDNGFGELPKVQYEDEYNINYYKDIKGLKGDNLLEGLALISRENHKTFTSYNSLRSALAMSDEDPKDSTKIIDFYTHWSIDNEWDGGDTWNREHVWCQSLSNDLYGTSYAGSDIHHIRPSISSINGARNNALYTDSDVCGSSITLTTYTYNGKDTGCFNKGQDYWEPSDDSKGDVARILMYMYMHYSTEVSNNIGYKKDDKSISGALKITNIVYTSSKTSDAAWNMLLKWNTLDPVDALENNRNNYSASVTGVRNPFIDHSEFANMIWNKSYNGDGALNDTETPEIPDTPVTPEEPDTPSAPDISTSATYTFSDYSAGTQYADNEKHVLDDNTTVITTDCHFTEQLRIYASSTYNGFAIIESKRPIIKMDLNLGYKIDTLNIYSSENGSTWTFNTSVTTTSNSYKDYSVTMNPSSTRFKLDVKGENQIRIQSMTLYFEESNFDEPANPNEDITNQIKNIETKTQLDFSYSCLEGDSKEVQAKSIVQTDITANESNVNYASNVNLDANIFNVSFIKGDPTAPVIKKDGTIRLYANRKSGNGNTLIIELKNKNNNINDISFISTNSNYLVVKDSNGDIISPINSKYEINGYKFTIQNTHYDVNAANNVNAFISLININYGNSSTYSNFNSINLRYSALIPNDLFEKVESYGINIKIENQVKDYTISKTTNVNNSKEFALVIKNVKDLKKVITATAYVYVGATRVELISKSYSIESMIDYYLLNATSLKLTQTQIDALTAFKESI